MAMNEPRNGRYGRFNGENTRWTAADNQRALRAGYEPIFFVRRGNSMIKTYPSRRGWLSGVARYKGIIA